jgi:hypothetical protein
MNKASIVTLWVDPKTYQILQYTFKDLDWDFFPGRTFVRIGDTQATMQMARPFLTCGCRAASRCSSR